MTKLERTIQLASAERQPFSGAVIFDRIEDAVEAIFGPLQHDRHVTAYRHRKWLDEQTAISKFRASALDRITAEMIAKHRKIRGTI